MVGQKTNPDSVFDVHTMLTYLNLGAALMAIFFHEVPSPPVPLS